MKHLTLATIMLLCLFGVSYGQAAAAAQSVGRSMVEGSQRSGANDRDHNERSSVVEQIANSRATHRASASSTPNRDVGNVLARLESALDRYRSTTVASQRATNQAQRAEILARYDQWRGSEHMFASRAAANEAARQAWEARAQMNHARQEVIAARRDYWVGVSQQDRARQAASAEQNRAEQQRWNRYRRNYFPTRQ